MINLESIEVGYNCFSNVNLIELINLPKLTSIISHNQIQPSFLPSSSSSSSSYGGTFMIDSLPLLQTIHLEGNSFDEVNFKKFIKEMEDNTKIVIYFSKGMIPKKATDIIGNNKNIIIV